MDNQIPINLQQTTKFINLTPENNGVEIPSVR